MSKAEYPQEYHQGCQFLMIYCYTHRLVSSQIIIREASSGIRQEQIDAETHREYSRNPKEGENERLQEESEQNNIRKTWPTVSTKQTNQRCEGLTEKEERNHRACMSLNQVLHIYSMVTQLGVPVGCLTVGVSDSCLFLVSFSSYWVPHPALI